MASSHPLVLCDWRGQCRRYGQGSAWVTGRQVSTKSLSQLKISNRNKEYFLYYADDEDYEFCSRGNSLP